MIIEEKRIGPVSEYVLPKRRLNLKTSLVLNARTQKYVSNKNILHVFKHGNIALLRLLLYFKHFICSCVVYSQVILVNEETIFFRRSFKCLV